MQVRFSILCIEYGAEMRKLLLCNNKATGMLPELPGEANVLLGELQYFFRCALPVSMPCSCMAFIVKRVTGKFPNRFGKTVYGIG